MQPSAQPRPSAWSPRAAAAALSVTHPPNPPAAAQGRAFYFDIVHPDGNTGHRVMGELAAQLILDAWAQVLTDLAAVYLEFWRAIDAFFSHKGSFRPAERRAQLRR